MADVIYKHNVALSAGQFIDLLNRSTLGLRRPVDDPDRIEKMLRHGNILVTAWAGDQLVGVSRALSDFAFCCYLSDLAVDEKFQHQGIGKRLIEETHLAAGKEKTTLILLSAPAAMEFYPKTGIMEHAGNCFVIARKK